MAAYDSTKKFITGLLIGGLAGAAATMLYAPQSGDDTRRMIRTTALDAKVKTTDGLRMAQEQISSKVGDVQSRANDLIGTVTEDVRRRGGRLKDIGQETLQEQKESLQRGASKAQDVITS